MCTASDAEIWTPLRSEIRTWLRDRTPSLEDPYVAAVTLLYTPHFPSRIYLICHLIRDLYDKLPLALGEPSTVRATDEYSTRVDTISRFFNDEQPTLFSTSHLAEEITYYRYTEKLHSSILSIVQFRSTVKEQRSKGHQLAYSLYKSGAIRANTAVPRWVVEAFDKEFKFFKSYAHVRPTTDDLPSQEVLAARVESFENAFQSIVGSYYVGKDQLDEILQDTNEATD